MFGLGFLMILPFVGIGSLLPTWMFINALQLLAHLPLLNTAMPSNAHWFLNEYLNMVRWYDEDFIKNADEKYEFNKYDISEGHNHELLRACNYEHLFIHNMYIVFIGISIICVMWGILAIKDLVGKYTRSEKPYLKKRHGKWCNNFALRFFYEFFLEFCIVVFINLSVIEFSDGSSTISALASIVLIVLICSLVIFVVTLFFCNGPYVPGFYVKRTALASIWGLRPADPSFDSYAWLKANRLNRRRKKGWYKFVISDKNDEKMTSSNKVAAEPFTEKLSPYLREETVEGSVKSPTSTQYQDMIANNDPIDTM